MAHHGRLHSRSHLRTRCPHYRGLVNIRQLDTLPSINLSLVRCGLQCLRLQWDLLRLPRQHGPCIRECRHIRRRMLGIRHGSTRRNNCQSSKFPETQVTQLKPHFDGRTTPIAWTSLPKEHIVCATRFQKPPILLMQLWSLHRWTRLGAILGKGRRRCYQTQPSPRAAIRHSGRLPPLEHALPH